MALSVTSTGFRWMTRMFLVLGLLLLIAAPILRYWVTPGLAQSPIAPGGDGFLTHVSTGTITTLFDLETAEGSSGEEPIPVTRTQSTRSEAAGTQEAVDSGFNAAVTTTTDRTETADGRLIADSEYTLAADRHSQALIDCCGVQVGGVPVTTAGAGSPLRLPWFTPQEPYPYYDVTLLAPVDMTPIGDEEVGGITAMKFQQAGVPVPIGTIQVPGRLTGSEVPTVPLVRTRVVNRTIWVDPTTGIVLRNVERVRESLRDSTGRDVVDTHRHDHGQHPGAGGRTGGGCPRGGSRGAVDLHVWTCPERIDRAVPPTGGIGRTHRADAGRARGRGLP